ncbi:YitT family protein [Konateibacter massiliensis]|uniref:YitT family protein n=1 Tax=Konateibacter massiliensis TaxID=2002841 RepID=UPI000C144857|nr:YitT family protein [Konateibacter massiliensis]
MENKKLLFNILVVIFGNILYASGIVFFILPVGLITGGTTGIALSVNHFTGLPMSYFIFGFNMLMFLLGFVVLGKKFALTTLVSTFCYPIALEVLQKAAGDYRLTDDIFLCTLFGGICIGAAIAMVIRAGASTGGMDIPPLILNKYTRISVSVSLYVADCVILVLQAAFSDSEKILYGIVLVLIYTIVLDKLLVLGSNKMQLEIVSKRSKEIKEAIIDEIDRGVTLLHGSTGYLEKETDIVLSVVSNRELYKVEKLVHQIDEEAFVMISRVSEVRGRGFSAGKRYLKHEK